VNTRWRHGPSSFIIPPLVDFVGPKDGIFALPAIIDLEIGEEMALYIRDQTPFMEQLRLVKPFRLMLQPGVGRNQFGPVGFLLFWVPSPADPETPFAAFDVYLNPHNEQFTRGLWARTGMPLNRRPEVRGQTSEATAQANAAPVEASVCSLPCCGPARSEGAGA
jgi:hypothetical protein